MSVHCKTFSVLVLVLNGTEFVEVTFIVGRDVLFCMAIGVCELVICLLSSMDNCTYVGMSYNYVAC